MNFFWSRLDSWYNYCNILEYFTSDFSSELYFNYIFNRVFHCIVDPNLDGTVVSNMALSRFHRIAYMVAEKQDQQRIGEILYICRRLLVIRLSEGWGGLGKKSLAEVVCHKIEVNIETQLMNTSLCPHRWRNKEAYGPQALVSEKNNYPIV